MKKLILNILLGFILCMGYVSSASAFGYYSGSGCDSLECEDATFYGIYDIEDKYLKNGDTWRYTINLLTDTTLTESKTDDTPIDITLNDAIDRAKLSVWFYDNDWTDEWASINIDGKESIIEVDRGPYSVLVSSAFTDDFELAITIRSSNEYDWWWKDCDNDFGIGKLEIEGCYTPAAPVPEPGTMALMGIGLIGLAGFLRKKNNNITPASFYKK